MKINLIFHNAMNNKINMRKVKMECQILLKYFKEKAHDVCCCFVALLKTSFGKITKKTRAFNVILKDKNTLNCGRFDFYNLVNFRHLQKL